VQTKCGHQEGAAVGHNPQKRGRKSFHPLLAVAAGTRLCPYYRLRSGDTVTASQWESAMEECQPWLSRARVWLNRGDLGLGHERICAWHEAQSGRPHYLFRLQLTANVKRAIAAVPEADGQGPARLGGAASGRSGVAPARLELLAARPVQSGRQKTLQVNVSGKWWEQLQTGYQQVCAWLATTALQLKSGLIAAIESEIKKLDEQIDTRVYKLFGLTPDEIIIVEDAAK
jgi:hypothetical protein